MIRTLTHHLKSLAWALLAFAAVAGVRAETAAPAGPTPEERIAALEAYMNNVAPTKSLEGVAGPGHNAWIMTSSALVLFMTLPGLALFYGGLVRKKNVLSVLAQCLGIAGLVTILWWAVGYSLVFGKSFGSSIFGGTEYFFLKGVGAAPNTDYAGWVSQNVFSMYQLMFAIITPALIVGAIAERMKFTAIMAFVAIWMFVVYFPLAHMVWGSTGLMNGVWNADAKIAAIDFAGGTVVHMSSGWSALILCLILGPRLGFGKEKMAPHSMVLCMVGTGMLWAGWYGFNAGSALGADGIAGNAFLTTTIAAGVAAFVWGLIELIFRKHASILGFCSGAVAGLVVITPAAGFVNANGAVIIGILAAVVPYLAVTKLKNMFGYDDALDTFGVHAVGGTLGALVTGFLATSEVNSNLVSDAYAAKSGLKAAVEGGSLWLEQLKAIGLTLVLSVVATFIIAKIISAVIGLRPSPEVERQGLDINEHGEEGYVD
ncbi:ammonium transporter [Nibricoccus sp. IMCC34717]|uniref:ammonium transporter n=1 Tax=Nibricoccus sp. IMCC34717 TaxID=3034021 RepID=UPI00384CDDEA